VRICPFAINDANLFGYLLAGVRAMREQQRVFVGVDGTKPEEQKGGGRDMEKGQLVTSMGGLEFEVYNQGMFKTELCNKWEEAGACRYADQCQFAHGIAELRPIIRHPRYKTQVCRMIIGGGLCPYGHRCHFRHSITAADHPLLLRA
jgi:butyrate response factor 1